jgi:hypothetical protein
MTGSTAKIPRHIQRPDIKVIMRHNSDSDRAEQRRMTMNSLLKKQEIGRPVPPGPVQRPQINSRIANRNDAAARLTPLDVHFDYGIAII